MKVLFIWEEIHERTQAFLIENPSKEELEVLEKANNKLIYVDEDIDSALLLSNAVSPKQEYCDPNCPSEWNCKWRDKEVTFPVEGPIDRVYISGFYS